MVYQKGQVRHEGPGLAFWYFAPSTSLIAVPLGSTESHFIFEETTSDFQEVTIQGQVTYRISNPAQASQFLNYTLDSKGERYVTNDPEKLPQRVTNAINVLVRSRVQQLSLREAMASGDSFVAEITPELSERQDIKSLGLEILGLSILAIKPTPDTARALEAETREQLMKEADDAVYARRNASVEHERSIKENELMTEKAIQEKRHDLESADTRHSIGLEEQRNALVTQKVENARLEADSRAYALEAVVKALSGSDPKVVQALASTGMQPEALIAAAMNELAGNAEKIGELNISPDLLRELLKSGNA
ncbi:MAG: SPFH domain-containing protein [Verrucomicrobiales bacterium]|nr:SPFH domain-containing protein [Verrucomicrobiales bacterium]